MWLFGYEINKEHQNVGLVFFINSIYLRNCNDIESNFSVKWSIKNFSVGYFLGMR